MNKKTTIPDYIANMDWDLLRRQKAQLSVITETSFVNDDQLDAIQGVLSLIDAIQDHAVDELHLGNHIVFNKKSFNL